MQATKPDVGALVGQMPDADTPGKTDKFTGPDPTAADKVFDEILSGGRGSIEELIAMIHDTTDPKFKDFRPEYVLHCLAVRVGGPGKEVERKMLADTLASLVADEKLSAGIRGVLLRQLQVAGGRDAVEAIGKQLLDDALCETATQALTVIREGAVEQLRKALPGARGRNRVTIVQALGVLRDAGSLSALREAAGDADRDVRIAAAWALANTGDPAAADAAIKASEANDGWERIEATKACLLLAEKLRAAGKKGEAVAIYRHLKESRKGDSEAYVREAAERGLAAAQ